MTRDGDSKLERIVREYERLGLAGDLERRALLFQEDAVFYDPVGLLDQFSDLVEPGPDGLPPAFRGRTAIIGFWRRVRDVFPGLSARVIVRFVAEEAQTVGFEWEGVYALSDGTERRVRALDVFQVKDGLIEEVRGYMARPDTFMPPSDLEASG